MLRSWCALSVGCANNSEIEAFISKHSNIEFITNESTIHCNFPMEELHILEKICATNGMYGIYQTHHADNRRYDEKTLFIILTDQHSLIICSTSISLPNKM